MRFRFLRLKQIIGTPEQPGIIPVSSSTWWAGVKSGRFPKPIKLGPRTTVWLESDIEALADRSAGFLMKLSGDATPRTLEEIQADVDERVDFGRRTYATDQEGEATDDSAD